MNKKQTAGSQPKGSQPKYTDFIYGAHACIEMLTAKRRKIGTVYTTKHEIKSWAKIKNMLPAYVKINLVPKETLDNITNNAQHQGIVIFTSPFPFEKTMFEPTKNPFIVLLDGIQDVGNLGAIIRSSYCAGVDGIVLCGKNNAPLTPAAIKASAGLAEHCKIFLSSSIGNALIELKKNKYNFYVATLEKGVNASEISYSMPAALIIGNEEHGVSAETLKAGTRVLLPQKRPDISYNASVAAGILMFLMGVQFKKIS